MNQTYKICSQFRTSKYIKKRSIIRRYSRDVDGIEKPLSKKPAFDKMGEYTYKALRRDISEYF